MTALPLAGRSALVLGVERPLGRAAAVALAEAGADVAACSLSEETAAEFAANSTANEFWAIGRKGIALTSDGGAASVRVAIASAAAELGPISICVIDAPLPLAGDAESGDALGRDALSGLRSDPAVIVLIASDTPPEDAHSLMLWAADLAAAGLRANAIAPAALRDIASPLTRHEPPDGPLDAAAAVVHLASDASAAVEGALVVFSDDESVGP